MSPAPSDYNTINVNDNFYVNTTVLIKLYKLRHPIIIFRKLGNSMNFYELLHYHPAMIALSVRKSEFFATIL
jgi:hypothetical protein